MSRLLGKELTEGLWERLNGSQIELYEGKIIPIFTIDEAGWAHPALLSYYEIVAQNRSVLDLALWKESSTANNLRRAGKVTLVITDHGVNFYLKASARELEREMAGAPPVSRFRVTLDQVIEDQEPNAEILTGMTYRRMTRRDSNDFSAKVFRLLREAP
ncbi:MAG TPA: hypothetical protein VNN13_07315 [Methylomirabilota bacterium]|jgi:hypothetical protein|nr:hypothetical protein [Methylomirabilota bacterium]